MEDIEPGREHSFLHQCFGRRKALKGSLGWAWPRRILLCLGLAFALVFLLGRERIPLHIPRGAVEVYGSANQEWAKPPGLKVVGLVFFGRPVTVAVLDCYLKKNLAANPGWLDEVHWVDNTDKKEDLAYLENLLETNSDYKKVTKEGSGYKGIWEHAVERGNMYIKIDDDLVRDCSLWGTHVSLSFQITDHENRAGLHS